MTRKPRKPTTQTTNDYCASCHYWRARKREDRPGHCRRYPEPLERFATDWCGEYMKQLATTRITEAAANDADQRRTV